MMSPKARKPIFGLSTIALFLVAILFLGYAAFAPGLAKANGRAKLISAQESGPYFIEISLLPGQAVVGNTHISVRLRSLETDEVLTTAKVAVSAAAPEGGTGFENISAPNDISPTFFETDLPFDMIGDWQVSVAVVSQLGETSVTVLLEVKEGGGGLNFIFIAAVVVIILAVGVFVWGRFPGRGRAKPDAG